jgi:hypothetical protein
VTDLPTKPTVTLFSVEPVELFIVVTDPDEREPGKHVLTTFAGTRRIARRPMTQMDDLDDLPEITKRPRQLMYVAIEDDPGIFALLYALVPDDADAWKVGLAEGSEGEEVEAVYLGTVVRAQECRVAPNSLLDEAADHFAAILGGKTVEPIDQLLMRLA